jgi:DNA repair exonuclease SbcCD nuclease subunit
MRFAHISDTHLGYRQYNLDEREEDFYKAFHEAVDKIIASDCEFVIHSGDLFDEPRPHVRALVEVRRALDRLHEEDISFFTIAGNHDILMRRGAMIPHAIYRRMEVLTPKKPWREFDGVFIAGMPYHSKIHVNALKEGLKELAKKAGEYEGRILTLHQGIDKYFGLEYELKIGDIPEGFDYYALGHIHKRVEDILHGGKLVYPGSTEVWRIDELPDYEKKGKGFVVVDTKDFSIRRVSLEGVRPFVKVEVDSDLDVEGIREMIKGEKRPVLRIVVASDAQHYQGDYQELVRELGQEVLYLDVKRKKVAAETEEVVSKTIDIRELMEEAMEGYSEGERDFAYSIFKLLASGNIDDAMALSEEFCKGWNPEKKDEKSKPPPKVEVRRTGQSSLEAFT